MCNPALRSFDGGDFAYRTDCARCRTYTPNGQDFVPYSKSAPPPVQCNPTPKSNTQQDITLSGPSCVSVGSNFTVEASGDWKSGDFSFWTMDGVQNNNCKNAGCGFKAPNKPGPVNINYNIEGRQGALNIDII
jgi:hypothetical protein